MAQLIMRNINFNKVRIGFRVDRQNFSALHLLQSLETGTWLRLRNIEKFRPSVYFYQNSGILFDRSFNNRLVDMKEMLECNAATQIAVIQPDSHICLLLPLYYDVVSCLVGCYSVYERSVALLCGLPISQVGSIDRGGGGGVSSGGNSNNSNNSNNGTNSAVVGGKRSFREAELEDPITPLCLVMVSPVPAIYSIKVDILSFTPSSFTGFVSKVPGSKDTFDYLFSLSVQDNTDRAEVLFHGETAAAFIGVPASMFRESSEIRSKVKATLMKLIKNSIPIELRIQLYYTGLPNSKGDSKGGKGADRGQGQGQGLSLRSAIEKVHS